MLDLSSYAGDFFQLTFVGQVVNAVASAASVNMTVIDGTGGIEVRQWLESKGDGDELIQILPYALIDQQRYSL
jgi:hypothetical protein